MFGQEFSKRVISALVLASFCATTALAQQQKTADVAKRGLKASDFPRTKQLAPGASLDGQPNRVRAEKLYREGQRLLRLGTFTHARAYLEQAVDAEGNSHAASGAPSVTLKQSG